MIASGEKPLTFLKVAFLDKLTYEIAFVVAASLMVTVIVAKTVGCLLPILAKKTGFDPAVMASPFITTIVDALSLVVYFNIARAFLNI